MKSTNSTQKARSVDSLSDQQLNFKVSCCRGGCRPKMEMIARALNNPNCLPDYCNSLDAAAEFEKTLNHFQRKAYVELLMKHHGTYGCVFATPRQRCITFVLVMEEK